MSFHRQDIKPVTGLDEYLFDISVKWGVSATEIKALNNLTSDDVTPGQTLMIPAPRAE